MSAILERPAYVPAELRRLEAEITNELQDLYAAVTDANKRLEAARIEIIEACGRHGEYRERRKRNG